jgi:hypothetical protein
MSLNLSSFVVCGRRALGAELVAKELLINAARVDVWNANVSPLAL